MKKHHPIRRLGAFALALGLLTVLLTGCTSPTPAKGADEDGRLVVYTSFYPMYDFTKKIGGDRIVLENIMPAGSEPHHWEPTASDIASLEKADVFLYNGAGMEHWVEDVLSSLSNKELHAIALSDGLDLIHADEQDEHAHEDHDSEDHEHEDHEDEEHAHEDGESHEGHSHGEYDPHVWLGPREARLQLLAVKNALTELDPANASYYEENFKKWDAEFAALDTEYTDTLASVSRHTIVTAHRAFGYLCRAYGLEQTSVEGLSPESEPSPSHMADIIDFVKEHNISVVFFEETASPKVAETIAAATGATTDVLYTIEALSDEQAAAGEDYLSLMRKNLEALKKALS